jgi:hypothetical protein
MGDLDRVALNVKLGCGVSKIIKLENYLKWVTKIGVL